MPRNRAKRDAKNSRSAERGCSSALTPPNRRRMVGARNPAPPRAGYAAQSRKVRCKKTAGALSEAVPLPSRRRTGGEWLGPATLPHHQQAMPRNRAKRDAKNSRSAERGCSSVLPPPNRRRMVGARNPAPPLAGYAAPYAAETSRYVPPLYTYPTKFMHNLCHIVM